LKIFKTKRAGRITQVVKHLPSKHEALSSNTTNAPSKRMINEIKEDTDKFLNEFQENSNKLLSEKKTT
jgi:hypothetical protein